MAFNKNKVMDAARRFVEKGQTEKAIKEYLRVVKEDPQDVRVWLKIGDLYAKKGDKVEAVDTYSKVAKFYSEQGFYLKAVAVYKQIVKLEPRLIEVHLKLAELYRQLGLMSDAMRHFEMVAGHFHREGKTREALATVRQLVELDPENVATRIKLAELYSKEGMVEEAVAEFTHACEYLRANARHDDFVKVAERLLWHKPENMELSRELAGFYLQRNDPRRALQKLQLCFKANARDTDTLALLAQAFQALEQKSKTVQVLKELARVFDEDGRREQAADAHRKILTLVPQDADALAYLGHSASAAVPPPPPPPPEREVPPPTPTPERRRANPTGSVPLLDPSQIPGLRYESDTGAQQEDFTSEFTQDTGFEGTAAGEIYAEEIAKLLTETEVYVKYGLHQKAIEHLRRVFELDELNIDARERLKEILIEQGREAEAMAELIRMADIMASHDHERTLGYLRETLAIDRHYQPAFELARRYNLQLGDGLEAPHGAGAEDEVDFDDIGFGSAGGLGGNDFEFDLGEDSDPDLDAGFGGASVTRELGPGEVEAMLSIGNAEHESDALGFDARAPRPQSDFGYDALELIDEPVFDAAAAAAFDAEPGYVPNRYPAKPAAAQPGDFGGFDGEPAPTVVYGARGGPGMPDMSAFGFDPSVTGEYGAQDFDAEPLSDLRDFADDFARPTTGERPTRDLLGAQGPDQTMKSPLPMRSDTGASMAVDTGLDILDEQLIDRAPPSGFADVSGNLEDELDEVDFYLAQGLYDDARETLNNMLARNPDHPLLITKMQDIDGAYGAGEPTKTTEISDIGFAELDELDALALDMLEPVASPPQRISESRPAVFLENPVDDEDADTHFDLGLAYKEMGLFNEAIKAFKKVADSPGREVQCRMMIGLCLREQGTLTDAIGQFKAGLHAPEIIEAEQLSLYYEIGYTYEMLRDTKEALYYYQIVIKRDPQYRDVPRRMHALTGTGPRGAGTDSTKPGQ